MPAIFQVSLLLATFLCSLVAGFLFAYAVVAMPGIHSLADGEFIRAFQAMDRVIQDNQPLFILVWVGSVLALIAAAGLALGTGQLEGSRRWLLLLAAALYLLGVQLPMVATNVPLNNQIQLVESDRLSAAELQSARAAFEPRWNQWNNLRTANAALVSALLILLLFSL